MKREAPFNEGSKNWRFLTRLVFNTELVPATGYNVSFSRVSLNIWFLLQVQPSSKPGRRSDAVPASVQSPLESSPCRIFHIPLFADGIIDLTSS